MDRRVAFLLACTVYGSVACAPNGRIADDSRTEACNRELLAGLASLGTALGLPYAVPDNSGSILIDTGHAELIYVQGGVKHACRFGLKGSGASCELAMFEKSEYRPGVTETRSGDYGKVALKDCRCAR